MHESPIRKGPSPVAGVPFFAIANPMLPVIATSVLAARKSESVPLSLIELGPADSELSSRSSSGVLGVRLSRLSEPSVPKVARCPR
jgi:hypothetical protein